MNGLSFLHQSHQIELVFHAMWSPCRCQSLPVFTPHNDTEISTLCSLQAFADKTPFFTITGTH